MGAHRHTLLCCMMTAALTAALAGGASAQGKYSRGATPSVSASRPSAPMRGGDDDGGYRGGWGSVLPGIISAIPQLVPPRGGPSVQSDGPYVDGGGPQNPRRPPRNTARRNPSGAPPANERRMVPDEVVIEVSNSVTPQQINALQRRFNLTRIESRTSPLANTTVFRWRIPDRRSVTTVVRALETDGIVASAQPNYLFTTRQSGAGATAGNGDEQYLLAKLHLPQAHAIAMGDNVRVAVIDSGVDAGHPELAGAIAAKFDTLTEAFRPDNHGTAIAGLIAAHGKLTGAAPHASILAVRAFDPKGTTAEGSTFNILKALDWAAANRARIINMSFAGPNDPAIHRSLAAAHRKNIVLIAAAGNAGPKSPPLYPAADPNVIAVTATDADNKLFPMSNRGRYVALAAPGTHILVAIPDGAYEVGSGTSYSAAEVSGIAALMIQHEPGLTPDRLRAILLATARDLGAKGRDDLFGAGLADAYAALTMDGGAPVAEAVPLPVSRAGSGTR
ncbi:MAG TPA: S8 family serine peptidase [Pseudolabrys sp.]|nr:S8 family serine peptidase [Pseudolabrys sp.]